jgi:histidinol-phosphate aminotransferase
VFARLGSDARAKAAYQFLKSRGILVRYFDRPLLADGLRITVGTDDEIAALLVSLAEFATKQ